MTEPSVAQTAAELRAINAAERERRPFLLARDGVGAQVLFVLAADRWRVTVGRRADCDLPLQWDREVSRTHALLERLGDQWTIVDEGLSQNGTYVNGARVVGRHRLRNGDRICVGETVLTLRDPSDDEAESTLRGRVASGPTLTPVQREILIALCRPMHAGRSATPATNREIALEVYLSIDAVKAHLRHMFDHAGLGDVAQNEKRARLAADALAGGTLTARDF
jgi:hypothetical protein